MFIVSTPGKVCLEFITRPRQTDIISMLDSFDSYFMG